MLFSGEILNSYRYSFTGAQCVSPSGDTFQTPTPLMCFVLKELANKNTTDICCGGTLNPLAYIL